MFSRLARTKVQRENSQFFNEKSDNDDDDTGNDAEDDAPTRNYDTDAQKNSNSNQQKCVVALRKRMTAVNAMSNSESLRSLEVVTRNNAAEIKNNHKMLAFKYHPDTWSDRCMSTRKENEDIFKYTSNSNHFLR